MLDTEYPAVLLIALSVFVAGLSGCTSGTSDQQQNTAAGESDSLEQANFEKVDVHTHYWNPRPYLGSMLDDWNMRAVVVDLFQGESPTRESWKSTLEVRQDHPKQIFLCTSFDASTFSQPDFAEQTIAQLKEDIQKHGAIMVKVWKNIGMIYKDENGDYIQIDDPKFEPIWEFLKEQDVPVLAHIGEPRAAWRPLDEKSPHYTYYKNHPQYHNYQNSEVPDWTTIMEARDNWLANNPDLTVIGAHLGSMAYDTDVLAKRLEKYPNFYVDTAERFGDLVIQDSKKVRQFFIDYQDRILYGTDLRSFEPSSDLSEEQIREEEKQARRRLRIHWRFLTTGDEMKFVRTGTSFTAPTTGLDLPREVIEKVYHENAGRLLDL